MKKIKYFILILLCSFLCIPTFVSAKTDVFIENLYMDVSINEDGSITIKEIDSYKGSYNGLYASFGYKNPQASTFHGTKEDFFGSDIYNGSAITNLKVGDIDNSNLSFDSLNSENINYYEEVTSGNIGDYGVYEKEDDAEAVNLKVYNPSSRKKAMYYEYTILDMVVEHNDVSELAWTIFNGENMENSISNAVIKIHLPKEDKTMRAWGHGVLQGDLTRNSDREVTLTIKDMGEYNDLGVRVLLDKNTVHATKKSNIDGYKNIMEVEDQLAKEANEQREKARKKVFFIKLSSILWLIVMLSYLIYIYIKYDKEYKYNLNSEYYRELPATYSPATLEYLLKKNVSTLSFSTILLDLIRRKNVSFEIKETEKKTKDYVLTLVNEENISENEKILLNLLFEIIGKNKKVSMNQIKNYAKNESSAQTFLSCFNIWKERAKEEAIEEKFYEKHNKVRVVGILLALLVGIICYMDINAELFYIVTLLDFLLAIFALIYFLAFSKKTKKGIEHYTKWKAFKKFLKDFGRFQEKELPEVKLWGQYLIYAHILGCAKDLEKEMQIKLNAMEEEVTYDSLSDIYRINYIMNSNLSSVINSSVIKVVTASTAEIAKSHNSSSGGFGGGFSGGGGSFGGGGGRGSF